MDLNFRIIKFKRFQQEKWLRSNSFSFLSFAYCQQQWYFNKFKDEFNTNQNLLATKKKFLLIFDSADWIDLEVVFCSTRWHKMHINSPSNFSSLLACSNLFVIFMRSFMRSINIKKYLRNEIAPQCREN